MWSKLDSIVMVCLLGLSLLGTWWLVGSIHEARYAKVYVQNKLVYTIDLSKDGQYKVKGLLGPVVLSVKQGKVAVSKETSQRHLCSTQGYVNQVPIVCLPNGVLVDMQAQNMDTLIQ